MELYLEIIRGERLGLKIPIRSGLTFGRKAADIVLPDSKVSSRHARIEVREGPSFYIVDLQSSNGLKVQNERVPEVLLELGVKFQIGRTYFQVFESEESNEADGTNSIDEVVQSWQGRLAYLAIRAQSASVEKVEVGAFNPPIRMRFLQGYQTGTEWVLGYGPRQAGSGTMELRLEEPGCPAVAFEIQPHRNGPLYKTAQPQTVRLNGKELSTEYLNNGDVIEIGFTRIQVVIDNG